MPGMEADGDSTNVTSGRMPGGRVVRLGSSGEGDSHKDAVRETTPASLPPAMADLLAAYKPEDAEQPQPLTLPQVWARVLPTSNGFKRSSLCLDKLGVSLRPLIAADKLPESLHKCAVEIGGQAVKASGDVAEGEALRQPSRDLELVTEVISFPVSSIVDIFDGAEANIPFLLSEVPQPEPPPMPPPAPPHPPPASGTSPAAGDSAGKEAPQAMAAAPGTAAAPTAAASGQSGRKPALPFARARGPAGDLVEQPPTQHFVALRVKGVLAQLGRGHPKVPPHIRLSAQPPPPITVLLCLSREDDPRTFVQRVAAYKKYHLSVALSAYLLSVTAAAPATRNGSGAGAQAERPSQVSQPSCGEAGAMVRRMKSMESYSSNYPGAAAGWPCPPGDHGAAATAALLAPPAPRPRPADMLPPGRLPRVVTSDEGEVFWCLPRRQPAPSGNQPAAPFAGSQPPPKPAGGEAPPPPVTEPVVPQTPKAPPEVPAPPTAAAASDTAARPRAPEADDDVPPVDTPAPCLLSPATAPGRPVALGEVRQL